MKSRYFLHLAALSSFALAQPLFAKLGPAPGYFAAHGMTSLEVVLFAVGVVLLPPLILFLPELLVVRRRPRWIIHLLLMAALAALIALPPLGALPTLPAYVAAALLGLAFAGAYAMSRGVRAFTSVLALAPPLFLAWFLLISPTSKLVRGDHRDAWRADDSFRPPIVFLQFDALPSLLLETPDRRVDAVRFPNFARLAADGVWYRNASNVHENTVFSVPSFVDGQLPRKGTQPVVQDHNPNLFTVLGPTYRMNVAEEATSLCPYRFCRDQQRSSGSFVDDTRVVFNQIVRPEDARDSLPSIRHRWTDFDAGPLEASFKTRKKTPAFVIRHLQSGRIGRFERWLGRVGSGGARPELDYIHMFLPHEPREFIPDGRRYVTPDRALEGPPAYDNRFLSEQAEQRTILQLGYTDGVVGEVITRLKQLGIYDDALVVVVADHGESFVPPKGTPAGPFVPGHLGFRRAVTRRNVEDIGSIPMFIKYPHGHGPSSGIDDRYVRAVDVFPTIAHELALKLPPIAGRALQSEGYHGHTSVRVATTYDGVVRMPTGRWQRARALSLRRRARLLGSGSRSVYRFGPRRDLIGQTLSALQLVPAATPAHATLDGAKRLAAVNPVAPLCLCQLAGRIVGAEPAGTPLAIAINGRIVATAEGFGTRGAKKLNWAAMIPPKAYKDGRNPVQILEIIGKRKLAQIGKGP